MYVKDVNTGTTAKDGEPKILRESAGTAHVDGCNLLGKESINTEKNNYRK